ncbi:hypothetical protein [Streptomyces cinereoruber]|uniref:hypothetical protein n=1 Tax=Streptomyces cinereoruber TaxID=67260 RepID=UPI00363CC96F
MDATLTKPAQASYRPADGYATFVLLPSQLELGDITDHVHGPMRIEEITQRIQTWTAAGYAPNDWKRPPPGDYAPPPLARHIPGWARIRVYRRMKDSQKVPGHTKKVTSHNPVRRGCYTHVDGWNAACSCGWASPENPHHGKPRAQRTLVPHHAEALTAQTFTTVRNLTRISHLEDTLGERLPWHWHNSIATADLTPMGVDDAMPRLNRWAEALNAPIRPQYQGTLLNVFSPGTDPHAATDGVGIELRLPEGYGGNT